MRQIDNMIPQEIEMLQVKGMLPDKKVYRERFTIDEILVRFQLLSAYAEKCEATLTGIKLTLESQGGYEATISTINQVLAAKP